MNTKYRVEVNQDRCIGAKSCVAGADLTFRLSEQGRAEIISQDGNSDVEKLMAAQSCPTKAISVFDSETGEKIWPKETTKD